MISLGSAWHWLLLAAVPLLPGCSRPPAAPNIVVITDVTATSDARGMHAGVWHACQKHGFTRYWNAPTHSDDYDRQIELIHSHLHEATAGLVLLPDSPTTPLTEVVDAHDAGVPVVMVHAPLAVDPGAGVYSILNDNREAAAVATRQMFEGGPAGMTVAVSAISTDNAAVLQLERALIETLQSAHPQSRIVLVIADRNGRAAAEEALSSALTATPGIGGVFGLQVDSIYAASAQRHRPRGQDFRVIGFDVDGTLQQQLAAGAINALVVEDRYRMGELAVDTLAALRRHEHPERFTSVPPMLLTRQSLVRLAGKPPFNGLDR